MKSESPRATITGEYAGAAATAAAAGAGAAAVEDEEPYAPHPAAIRLRASGAAREERCDRRMRSASTGWGSNLYAGTRADVGIAPEVACQPARREWRKGDIFRDSPPRQEMTKGFEFEKDGRHFLCTIEERKGVPNDAWWWFAVSGDAQRYAPFRASREDTQANVEQRVAKFYADRLFALSQPTERGSHWGKRNNSGAAKAAAVKAAAGRKAAAQKAKAEREEEERKEAKAAAKAAEPTAPAKTAAPKAKAAPEKKAAAKKAVVKKAAVKKAAVKKAAPRKKAVALKK